MSPQARVLNRLTEVLIRRERWGSERSLVRRARMLLGSVTLHQWMSRFGTRIEPVNTATVAGEWVTHRRAARPGIVMYVHGGGFVACTRKTHRPITTALARETGRRVLSIDYRRAPEHRFPAALDDVTNAYRWLLEHVDDAARICCVGDSAGGGLVLSLMVHLRDNRLPLPRCAVCFSPWTDLAGSGESVAANDGRCHMFRAQNISEFAPIYLGHTPPEAPLASPLYADLHGLPPVLFQVGSTELLLDDSVRVHQRIVESGGSSELQIFDDMMHCWQMAYGVVPEATTAIRNAAAFIDRCLG